MSETGDLIPLLELRGVTKYYPVKVGGFLKSRRCLLKAVDGADCSVLPGESFGIAGESGSGKTTMGRLVLRLEKPTDGEVLFAGQDIAQLPSTELAEYRMSVQAVFQDASGSLNPRMRIKDIVAEPLRIHMRMSKAEISERCRTIVEQVGLPQRVLEGFPHELSGGQKQRVAIARAMIRKPRMLLLDEPVSALDVSVRAQVLNLLSDMQEKFGLTYMMISHDLGTLGHVSTTLAVMYLGRIVEVGRTEELYERPLHPYTQALFQAMPVPDPTRVKRAPSIRGEIGSALELPQGCRFAPRCPRRMPVCTELNPTLVEAAPRHRVACHLHHDPS
ncbi:oligopeptide/dipeptide ABC transporter, ATPase subunit [Rhizobium sp. CF080]|uniref:ABC transporter ATP-binding protein n=1 Tax=Rhizobium sp. (strain CF080) TaxID=1144310 RepID=UPI00027188B6|nr:ABC transporter ATP-binding protein [Rhizobium sp. CF080]EUB99298.1 oligopeptide/dipeptide ABC transporter, ATPase subunit [Rhizobium sp. CF080]